MGNRIPKLGKRLKSRSVKPTHVDRAAPTRRRGLADALFSSTQQRVLALFFGQPNRSFHLTEIIRLAGAGSGAVQREVSRLANSGLIRSTTLEGRKKLQANHDAPIFEELQAIIEKTIGLPEQLRAALEPAGERIRLALLFCSVAKGHDTATSDIDVLIVSDDLLMEEAFELLEPVEQRVARKISPTIYTSQEFTTRRKSRNPFLTKVLAVQHIVLLGNENELEESR